MAKKRFSPGEVWRSFFRRQLKLEADGDVVSCDDGIYRKCPECKQLVPQTVKMDDGYYNFLESHGVSCEGVDRDEMHPLMDLRGCITGHFDPKSGESKTHKQCQICGMALKDEDGNTLFQ